MPKRYRLALTFLYSLVFVMLACLKASPAMVRWAWTHFGIYWMLGGAIMYGCIPIMAIWLINKINRDWPALILPPEPIYAPEKICEEQVLTNQLGLNSRQNGIRNNTVATNADASQHAGSSAKRPETYTESCPETM